MKKIKQFLHFKKCERKRRRGEREGERRGREEKRERREEGIFALFFFEFSFLMAGEHSDGGGNQELGFH